MFFFSELLPVFAWVFGQNSSGEQMTLESICLRNNLERTEKKKRKIKNLMLKREKIRRGRR